MPHIIAGDVSMLVAGACTVQQIVFASFPGGFSSTFKRAGRRIIESFTYPLHAPTVHHSLAKANSLGKPRRRLRPWEWLHYNPQPIQASTFFLPRSFCRRENS